MYFLLSFTRFLAFVGIVLFAAWMPQRVEAQANKVLQTILVTSTDGSCLYQIAGQTNQDVFRIRHKGKVFITSLPTSTRDVRVTVEDDGTVEGTSDEKSKEVMPDNTKHFNVRSGIGRKTSHKVAINCCTDDACSNTIPAEPTTTLGALQVIPSVQEVTRMAVRGPDTSAFQPPNRSLRDGGPVMEVEDP